MNKMKVVWISHFSNEAIRDKLPLTGKMKYADFAPWITNMIREFEMIPEAEVHVIAPHKGLLHFTFEFEHNGIFYHFFKPELPFLLQKYSGYFPLDAWTGFAKNRFLVHRFIKKIKPDIINLHGAENDYYSATVLGIKNIPIYICIQGIYSNPMRFNDYSRPNRSRIKIEKKIHKKNKYFGISAPFMVSLINRDAQNPILFWRAYPLTMPEIKFKNVRKQYDFVFFARISHVKGIEEILDALAIVKKNHPHVSLNIIGPEHSREYTDFLKRKTKELKIARNVTFTGAIPCLADVHAEASKAKFSVLAPKFDTIPGTILESIFLGLPVVTTNVGGIPYLNKDGETVLMSQQGDVKALARNMRRLLDEPELGDRLKIAALSFVKKEFDSGKAALNFMKQYKAIIAHYREGQAIDQELLFDKKLFGVSA
jgi:glycosyltransferase involved in cell wall biosynthesis